MYTVPLKKVKFDVAGGVTSYHVARLSHESQHGAWRDSKPRYPLDCSSHSHLGMFRSLF
jgi:hypothetical protein